MIATEGSIKGASTRLGVGQSSLSAQLKQFEDTLGVKLFERQGKSLRLSETGELVLRYANDISTLGEDLLDLIGDRKDGRRRRIQIGVMDDIPKRFVTDLVAAIHRKSPTNVEVREGDSTLLLNDLLRFRLDLILSDQVPTMNESNRIYAKRIGRHPVSVFGTKKFLGLRRNFPNSLEDQPIILPSSHCRLRSDLETYFHQKGIQGQVVAECQDTALQKHLAVEGLGVVPLTDPAAEFLEKEKALFRLGSLNSVTQSLYLVAVQRKIENPIAAFLLKEFSL